jgi:hypothetical protein
MLPMKIGRKRTTFGVMTFQKGAVSCAAGGIIQVIFYRKIGFDIYLYEYYLGVDPPC